MSIQKRIKPEDLLEMKEQAVALALSMSGQFDAQIKEMKEAKAALENTQLILRTLAEAEQIKHAAVQFSEGERAQVDGIVAKAEECRLEILSHVGEAKAVLERAGKEKDITAAGWTELERERNRWEHAKEKGEAELKRRQEMVAEREASVAGELEKLRLQQDRLSTRLRQLEEVV